jgi:hypothetical protein
LLAALEETQCLHEEHAQRQKQDLHDADS